MGFDICTSRLSICIRQPGWFYNAVGDWLGAMLASKNWLTLIEIDLRVRVRSEVLEVHSVGELPGFGGGGADSAGVEHRDGVLHWDDRDDSFDSGDQHIVHGAVPVVRMSERADLPVLSSDDERDQEQPVDQQQRWGVHPRDGLQLRRAVLRGGEREPDRVLRPQEPEPAGGEGRVPGGVHGGEAEEKGEGGGEALEDAAAWDDRRHRVPAGDEIRAPKLLCLYK